MKANTPSRSALLARWVSIVSFFFFGLGCLTSPRIALEFERYGLPELLLIVGILQIAGAVGLAVGHVLPRLVLISSAGLAVLMIGAVVTRVRINDPLVTMLPATAFCILNIYIFAEAVRRRGTTA